MSEYVGCGAPRRTSARYTQVPGIAKTQNSSEHIDNPMPKSDVLSLESATDGASPLSVDRCAYPGVCVYPGVCASGVAMEQELGVYKQVCPTKVEGDENSERRMLRSDCRSIILKAF